jgi:hypothetical protein
VTGTRTHSSGGAAQGIATIPEFIWEPGLGIYLTVKGFKPAPILDGGNRESRGEVTPAPALG